MQRLVFATRAETVMERRRQWCAAIGSDDVDLDDDGIEASICGGDIGVARICSVAIGGQRIAKGVGAGRPTVPPLVKLVFQEEGACTLEQGSRALILHAGEWCVYDKAQSYNICSSGFSRQTAIVLPPAAVDRSWGWDRMMMLNYPYSRGADQVLYSALVAAVGQIGEMSDVSGYCLSQALVKLIELTLLSKDDGGDLASPRDARRAEILNYLDRHLADPGLDIGAITRAFSCSKRYLHKLFLDHGTTIGRTIWNRRLDRCHAELGDPRSAGRTITEIAFAWGFNDSHHFSRLFRERFGMSPRDFRKMNSVH